jgi:hypothetical protein
LSAKRWAVTNTIKLHDRRHLAKRKVQKRSNPNCRIYYPQGTDLKEMRCSLEVFKTRHRGARVDWAPYDIAFRRCIHPYQNRGYGTHVPVSPASAAWLIRCWSEGIQATMKFIGVGTAPHRFIGDLDCHYIEADDLET